MPYNFVVSWLCVLIQAACTTYDFTKQSCPSGAYAFAMYTEYPLVPILHVSRALNDFISKQEAVKVLIAPADIISTYAMRVNVISLYIYCWFLYAVKYVCHQVPYFSYDESLTVVSALCLAVFHWWHHDIDTFLCYWPFLRGILVIGGFPSLTTVCLRCLPYCWSQKALE